MQVNFKKPVAAVTSQQTSIPSQASVSEQVDTVHLGTERLEVVAKWAAIGSLPLIGSASTFNLFESASKEDRSHLKLAAAAGIASNTMGTISLVAGLLTGHSTAVKLGMCMMAGSAAMAGMITHSLTKS